MKRVISFTLSLIMILSVFCFAAAAADNEKTYRSGGYGYTILKDGTVKINSYTGLKRKITIPSKIERRSVSYIGSGAFYDGDVMEVTIPGSVKTIGTFAFSHCSALRKVVLKNGVKNIKYGAFEICDKLEKVVIPNSVTTMGDYVFNNCWALDDITIGTGITKMGTGTFLKTKYYENKNNFKDGCLYLGKYLVDCAGKIKGDGVSDDYRMNLKIKDGTTIIADDALGDARALKSVYIPKSVKYIGICAFLNCVNLEKVTIKHGVKFIGKYAFDNCPKLNSITIPSSVTTIGTGAFGYINPDNFNESSIKKTNFKISGYVGTAAEKYASENKFSFAPLAPKTPKVKISGSKDQIKVSCTKTTGATGFQIKYTKGSKSRKITVSTTKSAVKKIANLKEGKYKVSVRSFAKSGGKTVYSKWTGAKTIVLR